MKWPRLALASAFLLLLVPAVLHAQANNNCQPADPLIKWCPPQPQDSILPLLYFNPSLDANLETGFGNAGGRTAHVSAVIA